MAKLRFERYAPEANLLNLKMNRFCGESAYPPDQEFGLELELEGFGADQMGVMARGSWVAHQDPSLRGDATELVLRAPLSVKDIATEALPAFAKYKQAVGFKPHLSNRCSLHTHIDFSHKTLYTLCKFITLYALCEEYFFAARGPKRKGNHFCISLMENPNFALQFINAIETGSFQVFNQENMRYMAINFHALWKFGSVEVRLHEGEADEDRILAWVEVLKEMVDFAQNNYKYTPEDYLYQSSINGLDGFLQRELPKTWDLIKDVYHLSRGPLETAQDFAFGVSWAKAPKEAAQAATKKPQGPADPRPLNAADELLRMQGQRAEDGRHRVAWKHVNAWEDFPAVKIKNVVVGRNPANILILDDPREAIPDDREEEL